jgi:hypothetical protein
MNSIINGDGIILFLIESHGGDVDILLAPFGSDLIIWG